MKLNIKVSTGKTYSVDVEDAQIKEDGDDALTVLDLKILVQAVSEIPPERQRLIYKGRVLSDNDRLAIYSPVAESTMHLVVSSGTAPASRSVPSAAPVPAAAPASAPASGSAPGAPLPDMSALFGGLGGLGGMGGFGGMGSDAAGGLGGMGNMMSMLQNPALQQMMQTPQMQQMMSTMMQQMLADPNAARNMSQMAAQMFSGGAGAGGVGAGGAPDLSAMLGAFGGAGLGGAGTAPGSGGVQPSPFGSSSPMAAMLSDPAMISAAIQTMQQMQAGGAMPWEMPGMGSSVPSAGTVPSFPSTGASGSIPNAQSAAPGAVPAAGSAPAPVPNPFGAPGVPPFGGMGGFAGGFPGMMGMFGGAGAPAMFGGAPGGNLSAETLAPQLDQLAAMGFPNREANLGMLRMCGGNVELAIERLLSSA